MEYLLPREELLRYASTLSVSFDCNQQAVIYLLLCVELLRCASILCVLFDHQH